MKLIRVALVACIGFQSRISLYLGDYLKLILLSTFIRKWSCVAFFLFSFFSFFSFLFFLWGRGVSTDFSFPSFFSIELQFFLFLFSLLSLLPPSLSLLPPSLSPYSLFDCLSLSLTLILSHYIHIYIYIQGSLNRFPDFFSYGHFIDSTHMKLYSPSK